MIIDLTGSSLRSPTLEAISVEEFSFDWEAHNEWIEYRDEKMGSQSDSRERAIDVTRTALLDDHMRSILRRATCREIQSEVVEIIDNLSWSIPAYGSSISALAAAGTAAARIVELDYKERQRRRALAKEMISGI